MLILCSTEQYHPLQTGLATADYGLTYALAKAGHKVYCITSNTYANKPINRSGATHKVKSGALERIALEIASNLFVIEFAIVPGEPYYVWQGEVQEYQDFVKNFNCDLFITSAILTWTSDYIFDLLPQCQAKKKVLRSHGERALMHNYPKSPIFALKDWIRRLYFSPARYKKATYIPWLRAKLRQSLKYYDCVFFLHKRSHAHDYLKPYCKRVAMLPNGVFEKDICPPKTLESALQPTSAPLLNPPYLLNVSNYYKEKGQDFVLRAYYLSQTTIPLVFVGSLEQENTLSDLKQLKDQLERTHGAKEVHFLYQVERAGVLELFKNATLFLHASHEECFPMVILESMQCGVPFLCTDVGNVQDLCAPLIAQTPQEMAEKIDALLGDPAHYNATAKELHQTIQDYTYEHIIKRLLEV
ncbi:glycosyltransferase family 4 protein [Helicobacter ailurogastricus]|uniref:glycosyltransferase family 4 protein n=1 Tax=Helicobacter ailurogastricus TaxID=1578720 RepID=UPI0022BCAB8C|nr:glycosyltransferase family 4 protein [Helicobacter ailurogastricus]GLH57924.1 hypothetical protein NHP214376_07120 [Helicobacter ailurogastricus]GLH59455.1 hypothetical protein NHP214377_07220 [Helicobacter ailurogastricus]